MSTDLEAIVPDATPEAVDLFKEFVKYDSAKRMIATDALLHEYFRCSPLAATLTEMPNPKEKRGSNQKPELQAEVSFNEMFADLFELASK